MQTNEALQGFLSKLEERVSKANTLLCVGLDPHVAQLPEPTVAAAEEFCLRIVREAHPYAAAFKPNSAFFECFGAAGFEALKKVVAAIPKDIPVILDCKRGDIDTTANAYASAAYDEFGADAVTLSPYMGWDSVKPFVTGKYEAKGAFILCKTSNPSSAEMQLLNLANGRTLFEEVLQKVHQWNSSLGADRLAIVAGATDIPSLKTLRQQAPHVWILCPGVGAQGGEPAAVCQAGLRADGAGLLVSVSRALSAAADLPQAAQKLRDEINALRVRHEEEAAATKEVGLQDYQRAFLSFALQQQALKFGSFKLKSGRVSPYFFNAGSFCSGQSLQILGRCYAQAVRESGIEFDVFFGPAYKGIPLVTVMSSAYFSMYNVSVDLAYNRKEVKDHGEGGVLVGASLRGRRVLIVDDVITAGTAIRESVDILNHAGAIITGVVLCLDRQERASDDTQLSAVQQVVRDFNIPVFSIVTLQHLIAYLQEGGQSMDAEAMQAYRSQYGAALL